MPLQLPPISTDFRKKAEEIVSVVNRSEEMRFVIFKDGYHALWCFGTEMTRDDVQATLREIGKENLTKLFVAAYQNGLTLKATSPELWDSQMGDKYLDTAYDINWANGQWLGEEIEIGDLRPEWAVNGGE